jgi:DNA repair protein RadC
MVKGDRVVRQVAMSSGLSASSIAVPIGEGFGPVREAMIASGADGYYLLHNHPSGNITPSKPDINVTGRYIRELEGYKAYELKADHANVWFFIVLILGLLTEAELASTMQSRL